MKIRGANVRVGDMVKLTWRDSGIASYRGDIPPELLVTQDAIEYGEVVHIGKSDIVVANSRSAKELEPGNDMYTAIWIPSIQEIKVVV
jgi:hypothetical protein